jgi:hypothetical protein
MVELYELILGSVTQLDDMHETRLLSPMRRSSSCR